jgi:predicted metal-dependent hydrolase
MSATTADKAEFKERVRGWAERLDARVRSIAVRPMTTKWASYSTTGRLTFDATLLELREELQDYVIAHELLHSHAPNHGKLWKSLMRAHLGEYEQMEAQLRRVARDRALHQPTARRTTDWPTHSTRTTLTHPVHRQSRSPPQHRPR